MIYKRRLSSLLGMKRNTIKQPETNDSTLSSDNENQEINLKLSDSAKCIYLVEDREGETETEVEKTDKQLGFSTNVFSVANARNEEISALSKYTSEKSNIDSIEEIDTISQLDTPKTCISAKLQMGEFDSPLLKPEEDLDGQCTSERLLLQRNGRDPSTKDAKGLEKHKSLSEPRAVTGKGDYEIGSSSEVLEEATRRYENWFGLNSMTRFYGPNDEELPYWDLDAILTIDRRMEDSSPATCTGNGKAKPKLLRRRKHRRKKTKGENAEESCLDMSDLLEVCTHLRNRKTDCSKPNIATGKKNNQTNRPRSRVERQGENSRCSGSRGKISCKASHRLRVQKPKSENSQRPRHPASARIFREMTLFA